MEAVERQAEREERLQNFVKEALSADADVERTGDMYRAEEVHAWRERLATGQKAPRPSRGDGSLRRSRTEAPRARIRILGGDRSRRCQ